MPENDIRHEDGFLRDVRQLPKQVQTKLASLLETLRKNAFASELHTKPLKTPLSGKYSFRITRDWRVGFQFEGRGVIKLLAADNRSKIYRKLERF